MKNALVNFTRLVIITFCMIFAGINCSMESDHKSYPVIVTVNNQTLTGDYAVNMIGSDGDVLTARMHMNFDGEGTFTWNILSSSNNILESGSTTYSVSSSGTMTTGRGETGIVTSDGNVIIFTDTDISDGDEGLFIGIKESSDLSDSSAQGEYIGAEYVDNSRTAVSSVNFDGNGSATWETISDSDGNENSGTVTYAVDADGILTFTEEEDEFQGTLSQDGQFYNLISIENDMGIIFGAKKSTGMSETSLNGSYILNRIGDDENGFFTAQIYCSFDGQGNGSSIVLSDSRGHPDTETFTYTVSSDGTLTFDNGDGGAVSADGNIFLLTDTDSSDSELSLSVGIRKAVVESEGVDVAGYWAVYFTPTGDTEQDPEYWSITQSSADITGYFLCGTSEIITGSVHDVYMTFSLTDSLRELDLTGTINGSIITGIYVDALSSTSGAWRAERITEPPFPSVGVQLGYYPDSTDTWRLSFTVYTIDATRVYATGSYITDEYDLFKCSESDECEYWWSSNNEDCTEGNNDYNIGEEPDLPFDVNIHVETSAGTETYVKTISSYETYD